MKLFEQEVLVRTIVSQHYRFPSRGMFFSVAEWTWNEFPVRGCEEQTSQ